jgi:hypothetical protein
MWAALFGTGGITKSAPVLVLRPDASGKSVHGFQSGLDIRLTGDAGQTVGDLLEKLNKYRGPDQVLRHVWNPSGQQIPLSTEVKGEIVAIVRSASCNH